MLIRVTAAAAVIAFICGASGCSGGGSDADQAPLSASPSGSGVEVAAALAPILASNAMTREFADASRRVWVHKMIDVPTFQPATPFGADYPLVLRTTYEAKARANDGPGLLIDAGITGVELLWGEGQEVSGHFEEELTALDGTGVELAPCLSVQTVDGAIEMITKYVAIAKKHSSAAKITDAGVSKYIVSIYGARYAKATQFWYDVKKGVAAAGLPVFFTADLVSAISFNGGFFPNKVEVFAKQSFSAFLTTFDSLWTFDDGVDLAWSDLLKTIDSATRPFAGGTMPAYNRESAGNGGYSDPEATAKFRRQWRLAVDSGLRWNHVISWNDVSERHSIWPSAEWSYTRTDINAFYSTLLRGTAWPKLFATPQLYVTVPQRINVNQVARPAEALVLNSSAATVRVVAEMLDSGGRSLGKPVTQLVPPSSAEAAVIPVSFSDLPTGRFVRIRGTSFDAAGTQLQQVTSAPILVFGATEQASGFSHDRVKYNAIPARLALPTAVSLAVAGAPTASTAYATVTSLSTSAIRFVDILQNAYLAGTRLDPGLPPVFSIPMADSATMSGPASTPASGFYVGRIIDSQERIGYSDPVYFPPK